jgi:hypothetical protein
MHGMRRQHEAAVKAKVALEAIKGKKPSPRSAESKGRGDYSTPTKGDYCMPADSFLPVFVDALPSVGEELGEPLQKLRFPAADLVRVDVVLAGQRGDRSLSLERLEGDFSFK